MKNLIRAAIVAASLAGGPLAAQQPAPTPAPQPRQPGNPPAEAGPQGGRMDRRPMMAGGFRGAPFSPTMLLERRGALNLTPEQVTKLSTLENDLKAAREKAETDARPHREELQKLMEQGAPDVAQVRTHAQAMFQAEQAGQLAMLTGSVQAKAVLTPEQRGRVQGWIDARRNDGMPGGRGMRRPGPGGPEGGPGFRRPAGFGFQPGTRQM